MTPRLFQRWDRIRFTGVESGRILRFSFGPGPESKICEKPDPDRESLFHFGSSRSLSEVAGVTFSDSDSAPVIKFLNPGPNPRTTILQI